MTTELVEFSKWSEQMRTLSSRTRCKTLVPTKSASDKLSAAFLLVLTADRSTRDNNLAQADPRSDGRVVKIVSSSASDLEPFDLTPQVFGTQALFRHPFSDSGGWTVPSKVMLPTLALDASVKETEALKHH